jgi:protease I
MTRRILMLVGDHGEEYEIMIPFQALQMLGYQVHAICPGKYGGDKIQTAIDDSGGDWALDERHGHTFILNATFDEVRPERYDALIIPGGLAPEYLRLNSRVQDLVRSFAKDGKPIAAIGNGLELLAAAGVIEGRTVAAGPSLVSEVQRAGGESSNIPEDQAVVDGNLVTAPGWHAHPEWLAKFLKVMHADISIEELPLVTA